MVVWLKPCKSRSSPGSYPKTRTPPRGGGFFWGTGPAGSPPRSDVTANETTEPAETTETADAVSSSTYADGEYTATGSYTTPGGRESVTVTLTLGNDVVTAVSVDGSAKQGDSLRYQSEFIENIAS